MRVVMSRRFALVAALLFAAFVGWVVAYSVRVAGEVGHYRVIEGDTLAFRPRHCLLSRLYIPCLDRRLRLYGVDAFESKQTCRDAKGKLWPCGAVATARLRELSASPDFSCNVDYEFVDRHAREFAVCTVHGEDVGALLVRDGLAFAYGRGLQYLPFENEAKQQRRGAWAGRFVRPQYFREGATNE